MAQFGRALRSGRRGRVFESRRFDFQQKHRKRKVSGAFFLPKNNDLSIEKPHLSQYKYSNKQCKYRNSDLLAALLAYQTPVAVSSYIMAQQAGADEQLAGRSEERRVGKEC